VRALRDRDSVRHSAGFSVEVPCLWPCDSKTTSFFVDGPMLLHLAFVAAAAIVRRVLDWLLAKLGVGVSNAAAGPGTVTVTSRDRALGRLKPGRKQKAA
jgi:hypothetical protein